MYTHDRRLLCSMAITWTFLAKHFLNNQFHPLMSGSWFFPQKGEHSDSKTIGHLSTPSERSVLELPNACFSFEIGHS